jgi:hypothetical protein
MLCASHMKQFILKYKWTICYCSIVSFIILYFAPRQKDYYLDNDINVFKSQHLISALIWTWVVICGLFFVILLTRSKSFKQTLSSFFYFALTIAFFLFIFQDLFLAGSLFINRLFKRDSLTKKYVAYYLDGAEKIKDNFLPYDLLTRQISIDEKLKDKLYRPGLKQNDTINLKFDKGLLGIEFQTKPFMDK